MTLAANDDKPSTTSSHACNACNTCCAWLACAADSREIRNLVREPYGRTLPLELRSSPSSIGHKHAVRSPRRSRSGNGGPRLRNESIYFPCNRIDSTDPFDHSPALGTLIDNLVRDAPLLIPPSQYSIRQRCPDNLDRCLAQSANADFRADLPDGHSGDQARQATTFDSFGFLEPTGRSRGDGDLEPVESRLSFAQVRLIVASKGVVPLIVFFIDANKDCLDSDVDLVRIAGACKRSHQIIDKGGTLLDGHLAARITVISAIVAARQNCWPWCCICFAVRMSGLTIRPIPPWSHVLTKRSGTPVTSFQVTNRPVRSGRKRSL
ncbi:hypothetical protein BDB13_6026 [Rhodococcus sp. OK302]|nr:hypothetical protein BDB13_6026 [Rhodococcus sp. OK302]